MARLLASKPRPALLHIGRISYSRENIPIEFLHFRYQGDRYTLHSELEGSVPGPLAGS